MGHVRVLVAKFSRVGSESGSGDDRVQGGPDGIGRRDHAKVCPRERVDQREYPPTITVFELTPRAVHGSNVEGRLLALVDAQALCDANRREHVPLPRRVLEQPHSRPVPPELEDGPDVHERSIAL